ncbi:MAG: TPM domain-containing protein [Oscillospiraceae bacterium]|nr:TPM domain-containing protein [Oscillospiraceae bacterium]
MKRRLCCFFAALLLLGLAAPAAADGNSVYIYDLVGLFSADEGRALQARASELTQRYQCALYVVVVPDYSAYGRNPDAAAANIYRDNSFGAGNDSSGVMLLLSTGDRDYCVYYNGYGTYAVERWGVSRLEADMLSALRKNDWYGGTMAFLDSCAPMLAEAETSYDPADYNPDGSRVRRHAPIGFCIGLGLVAGCLAGLVAAMAARTKMRSVHKATVAAEYTAAGGISLYRSDDVFSHVTETRVRIESNSGGSRGGGGGRPSGGSGSHSGKF